MGIQKDAGEILAFLYTKYTETHYFQINKESLLDITKWDTTRLENAVAYLEDCILVEVHRSLGGHFFIHKIYPNGVNIIEDKSKFKKTFNFEIGVPGLFKFSWGATEK